MQLNESGTYTDPPNDEAEPWLHLIEVAACALYRLNDDEADNWVGSVLDNVRDLFADSFFEDEVDNEIAEVRKVFPIIFDGLS